MNLVKLKAFTALAGLALITAGCQKTDADRTTAAIAADGSPDVVAGIKSIVPNQIRFGDATTEVGPQNFKADFNALVYFGIDRNMKLVSSVQYFDASGASNLKPEEEFAAIKQQMITCIDELDRQNTNVLTKCRAARKAVDINDLTFRAPTNIVIAARNPTIKFGDEALVISDRTIQSGVKAMANKSFYSAKTYVNAFSNRDLVYVRNYYSKLNNANSDGDGQSIGDTPIDNEKDNYWYGLNIFMTIAQSANANPLPMIIDPDGGNMGGNP
jgi:hypothetical protein